MLSLGGSWLQKLENCRQSKQTLQDSGSSLGVDMAFAQPYDGRVAGKVEAVTMESWVPRAPVI